MSERAQRMGAVLQVCASPGNGCTVRLTLAVHIQTAQANNEPTQVISN
jgi:nitrate/nitrite-specific signal transduction histidine kinase